MQYKQERARATASKPSTPATDVSPDAESEAAPSSALSPEERIAAALQWKKEQQEQKQEQQQTASSAQQQTASSAPASSAPGGESSGSADPDPVLSDMSLGGSQKQAADEKFTAMLQERERQRNEVKAKQSDDIGSESNEQSLEMQALIKERTKEVVIETAKGEYKPKVNTWGVFPRPQNISKAYGGGRTIRPGEKLMSDEELAAKKKQLRERVRRYEQKSGNYVDPAIEAECNELLASGIQKMQRGTLGGAMGDFKKVSSKVNYRSRLGGEAALQYAICLDSMGRNKEAEAEYNKLANHPIGSVRKSATRMTNSFKAMSSLKTDSIDYFVQGQGAYNEFFKFKVGWGKNYDIGYGGDSGYKAPDPEEELTFLGLTMTRARKEQLTLILTLVVLFGAPLALVVALIQN